MIIAKKKIVLNWKLTVLVTIALFGCSIIGCSQDQSNNDTIYHFTGEQVKELLKSAYELDVCNNTVISLSSLIDSAQFKVNTLDLMIHNKNKQLIKQRKRKRFWRSSTIGITFVSVLVGILK